jgi:hypothetical protein
MTLVKDNQYIEAKEVSKPTKSGTRVISAMSTTKILSFVAYRHRVGLLGLSSFAMLSYIAYDKVVRLFI